MYELAVAEQGIQALLAGLASTFSYIGPAPLPVDELEGLACVYSVISAPDTLACGGDIVMSRPIYQIVVTGYGANIGDAGIITAAENMHDSLNLKSVAVEAGWVDTIQRQRIISLPQMQPDGRLRQYLGGWYRFVCRHAY